jgi:predicted flap endonuclease-1-like 5' DNA nuclease
MTELSAFLASLYDSLSDAEMQALAHGQARLAELLASETMPDDVSVPVYHASDVSVTLDVGLVAEETADGLDVHVTDASDESDSTLSLTLELFELLEREDLEDLEYENLVGGVDGPLAHSVGRGGDGEASAGGEQSGGPTVDVLDRIDDEHARRLREAGVERLTDLVDYSPEALAAAASDDTDVSPDRASDWLAEAEWLSAILREYEDELPVELVDGIGPTFGDRLRDAGVSDLAELVECTPEDVADYASTDETTVSPQRASEWLERAAAVLDSAESTDDTDAT